jgi:hypothetical protein
MTAMTGWEVVIGTMKITEHKSSLMRSRMKWRRIDNVVGILKVPIPAMLCFENLG